MKKKQLELWVENIVETQLNKPEGISKQEWENNPRYARARENAAEFGRITQASSYLMIAMQEATDNIHFDQKTFGKLVQRMANVKNKDDVNVRGERTVTVGGLSELDGYDFNPKVKLKKAIGGLYRVDIDTTTGNSLWTFGNIGETKIKAPKGTTHIKLTMGVVDLDLVNYANEEFATQTSHTETIEIHNWKTALDGQSYDVNPPIKTANMIAFTKMTFVQVVNGVEYPLNDQNANCCRIEKVF